MDDYGLSFGGYIYGVERGPVNETGAEIATQMDIRYQPYEFRSGLGEEARNTMAHDLE